MDASKIGDLAIKSVSAKQRPRRCRDAVRTRGIAPWANYEQASSRRCNRFRRRLAEHSALRRSPFGRRRVVEDWIGKANYATIARAHLVPAPVRLRSTGCGRPDVEALLTAKRDAGLSDSTVRLVYTVCRADLDIAVRDGVLRRNVAAAVKRPTIKRAEARYPDAGGGRPAPRGGQG
jgi:hypothetical protein